MPFKSKLKLRHIGSFRIFKSSRHNKSTFTTAATNMTKIDASGSSSAASPTVNKVCSHAGLLSQALTWRIMSLTIDIDAWREVPQVHGPRERGLGYSRQKLSCLPHTMRMSFPPRARPIIKENLAYSMSPFILRSSSGAIAWNLYSCPWNSCHKTHWDFTAFKCSDLIEFTRNSPGTSDFWFPVVCGFWPWFFSSAALLLYLALAQVAWSTSYDLICV